MLPLLINHIYPEQTLNPFYVCIPKHIPGNIHNFRVGPYLKMTRKKAHKTGTLCNH